MFDYKKIFASRELRLRILRLLAFIPDPLMVRIQYLIKTGRRLDLSTPTRYTEKIQAYKLYYRNPLLHKLVDKYEVRPYLAERGFEDILVRLYGIYDSVDQIDFESLPSSYVIKSTDGGGGNEVILVKDSKSVNICDLESTMKSWLVMNKSRLNPGREWAYTGIGDTRIIIEEFIHAEELIDYKFFCFDGVVKYLYVIDGRNLGENCRLGVYTPAFDKLPVYRADEKHQTTALAKPKNYDRMLEIAEQLSKGFPHVRIDMYNVEGKIYFGEFTFYDGSGYQSYDPDDFDFELGCCFDVTSFNRK